MIDDLVLCNTTQLIQRQLLVMCSCCEYARLLLNDADEFGQPLALAAVSVRWMSSGRLG